MSAQENDKICEAAYEDFYYLYFTSDSFASQVNELMYEYCDEYTKCGTAIKIVFDFLWKNDSDLLCRDMRTAVEALLMYHKSMKVFNHG